MHHVYATPTAEHVTMFSQFRNNNRDIYNYIWESIKTENHFVMSVTPIF